MNIKKLNDVMEQVESQGHMLYRTTTFHGQQYEQLVVHEIVKDTILHAI